MVRMLPFQTRMERREESAFIVDGKRPGAHQFGEVQDLDGCVLQLLPLVSYPRRKQFGQRFMEEARVSLSGDFEEQWWGKELWTVHSGRWNECVKRSDDYWLRRDLVIALRLGQEKRERHRRKGKAVTPAADALFAVGAYGYVKYVVAIRVW